MGGQQPHDTRPSRSSGSVAAPLTTLQVYLKLRCPGYLGGRGREWVERATGEGGSAKGRDTGLERVRDKEKRGTPTC